MARSNSKCNTFTREYYIEKQCNRLTVDDRMLTQTPPQAVGVKPGRSFAGAFDSKILNP